MQQHMHLIDNAKKACEKCRTYTSSVCQYEAVQMDASLVSVDFLVRISEQVDHAYHGPYEHITVEGMEKAVDMITELVKIYSTQCK